jgi:diketogulonate reductase-like aldo/keto reductase
VARAWRIFDKEGNEVIQSVKSAIGAGYRSIDTVSVYGNEQ